MTDPIVIADQRWFDVSTYSSWDDYNFKRPVGDTVLTVLARRDLFLDAARELNNPMLTNMSPEALAALIFAQTYVEEKWDHQPPWDGDSANPIFNWVHPVVLDQPNVAEWLYSNELDQLRSEYWWATYFSFPLGVFQRLGVGKGTDFDEALRGMRPPNANAPRLAGYAYPVGNQLYLQTAETAYWYADYLKYRAQRYGAFAPQLWIRASTCLLRIRSSIRLVVQLMPSHRRRNMHSIRGCANWSMRRSLLSCAAN